MVDIAVEVDGEPSAERSGTDVPLELGDEALMPELTAQLVGAAPGEEREVTLTPPEVDRETDDEAGSADDAESPEPAEAPEAAATPEADTLFRITVKEVRERVPTMIDESFAERRGAKDLDELRGMVREQIQEQYDQTSQARLKRSMLDVLDERHRFEVPPGMVENEFGGIWQQVGERREERQGRHRRDARSAGGRGAGRVPPDRRAAGATRTPDRRDRTHQ